MQPFEKQYSECVSVVLGIQRAQRLRRFILTSVACPALPYMSTLFFGKVAEHGMCFCILYDFVYNTFLYTRKLDIIIKVCRSSCKVSVIRVRF